MTAELPLEAAVDLRDVYRYAVFAENGEVFEGVPGETMRAIFQNRALAGRLIFHRNEAGQVDGLLIWYRFQRGWTMDKVYKFEPDDPNGSEIYISAAFCENDVARRWGIRTMLLKEPDVIWCKLSAYRKKGGKRKLVHIPQKLIARLLKNGQAFNT